MPQPAMQDVHVNTPLTNISVAYIQSQKAYRAAEIFPLIPVTKMSDKYFYYTKDYWFTNEAKVRAEGTESEGTGYGIDSSNTYSCDVTALHTDVGDMTMQNADTPLNMQRDASIFLTQKLLLAREKKFVDSYFKTGVWGLNPGGIGSGASWPTSYLYWDVAASTPVKDIRRAKMLIAKSTGFVPNTLVLGPEVFEVLAQHPDILDRVKYGGTPGAPATVTEQALAQVLAVDRVIVPMAVLNSGPEGGTAAYDFMYGKDAMLVYSNPTPSLLTPSAGYSYGWTGYLQGGGGYQNAGAGGWFAIRDFRMEPRRSLRIEAEMAMDMKLVGSDLGLFFNGCLTP